VRLTSTNVRRTCHCVTMTQCASICQEHTLAAAQWDISVNTAMLPTVLSASVSTMVHVILMTENGRVIVLSSTQV